MKRVINFVIVAIIAFIGVTGEFMHVDEHIPDNAKIYVLEEYNTWIPNSTWANEIFLEQASKSSTVKESYAKKIDSTYGEVIHGKYKNFQLPKSWQTGDYKARIFWGKDQSLLGSWIVPEKNRWNQNGTWNY